VDALNMEELEFLISFAPLTEELCSWQSEESMAVEMVKAPYQKQNDRKLIFSI